MLYTTYKLSYKVGEESMAETIIGVCYDLTAKQPLIIKHNETGKIITCQQLIKDSASVVYQ